MLKQMTDGTTTVTWTCDDLKNKEGDELKDITLTKEVLLL